MRSEGFITWSGMLLGVCRSVVSDEMGVMKIRLDLACLGGSREDCLNCIRRRDPVFWRGTFGFKHKK